MPSFEDMFRRLESVKDGKSLLEETNNVNAREIATTVKVAAESIRNTSLQHPEALDPEVATVAGYIRDEILHMADIPEDLADTIQRLNPDLKQAI